MDTSILRFYEQVESERKVETLSGFKEILFYTGSPDAEILIVSEAPTCPNDSDDHTLYHSVTEEMKRCKCKWIAGYLRDYPYQDKERNHLYEVYVEDILYFCDRPEEEIGFTDLCKKPLKTFDGGVDLREVWSDKRHCYESIIREQIQSIKPEIVVCNKKNVSVLLSQMYLGKDGYDGDGWPEETSATVESMNMKIVYSSMAHKQMSLLSRKRLSDEIGRLYSGG